jgi:hypothetical protein
VGDSVRTLTLAQLAGADYASRITDLDDYARTLEASGAPLKARTIRHKAAILHRAARAELIDPEPPERRCGTCGLVTVCDIAAHRERGW